MLTISNNVIGKESSILSKKVIYGKSKENRDLIAHIFFTEKTFHKNAVVMTGGVHGNEYLGLVTQLTKDLKRNRVPKKISNFLNSGGVIITVPRVNPDGVANRSRYLKNGKDLNRQFKINQKGTYESEAKNLTQFIDLFLKDQNLKLVFAVDYHCCGGSALLPSKTMQKTKFYTEVEHLLKKHINKKYNVMKTKEMFGQQFKGTLKDYWANTYHIPSLTLEASFLNEVIFSKKHMFWWGKVLSQLLVTSKDQKRVADLKTDNYSILKYKNGLKNISLKRYYSE